MAVEVRLHPRSPPRVSSLLLRLLPIAGKQEQGSQLGSSSAQEGSGHHGAAGAGAVASLCPRDSQGQQLLRKRLSPPSLGYLQTAETGMSASPKAPFHGEWMGSWSGDTKPLCKNAVCSQSWVPQGSGAHSKSQTALRWGTGAEHAGFLGGCGVWGPRGHLCPDTRDSRLWAGQWGFVNCSGSQ